MKKQSFLFSASVIVPIILMTTAWCLQWALGEFRMDLMRFPVNVAVAAQFVVVVAAAAVFLKKNKAIVWLSKSGAAISATAFFTLHVMLMALIPQTGQTGLHNIAGCWSFVFSLAYWMTALSFAIVKRMSVFSIRNIFFVLQHLGLLIAVLAGALGQADKQQAYLRAWRNELVWYAETNGNMLELPFAVKLTDFRVNYHAPQLALVNQLGEVHTGGNNVIEAVPGKQFSLGKFTFRVDDAMSRCHISGDSLMDHTGLPGSVAAALVTVTTEEGTESQIVVTPGNYMVRPGFIMISPDSVLMMMPPEPESFVSVFDLYAKSDLSVRRVLIEVNSPVKAEGWTIYQHGYDSAMGNDSQYSDLMIVKDPWLPVVYFGIFMLMLGALGLFFYKPQTKNP